MVRIINGNIKNIIRVMVCLLLILFIINILTFMILINNNVSAKTIWGQNTQIDFQNSTKKNVIVTSNSEIQLVQQVKWIEDDFIDESNIQYIDNLTIDKLTNEIKPIINKQIHISFSKTFGGISFERGYSVQQTNDGGYIIVGTTMSYGAGNSDIWLIKTNNFGIIEWNKTFGGSRPEDGYSVQQTNDGGFIIVGETDSFGAGWEDVWLIKTDGSGNELWNKTFGGSETDRARSVIQVSNNGFVIIGGTFSHGHELGDGWIIKTDSSGNEQWNNTLGGIYYDFCLDIQQTNDGGYIITGETASYSKGYTNIWLVKTNSMGQIQWNKSFEGKWQDMGYSVKQTNDNGYIVIGTTGGFSPDGIKICLIKTDKFGNMQWNRTFIGFVGTSVLQTSDEGYIFTGKIGEEIILIKTDSSGNEEYNRTFGEGIGDCIQKTSDDGYIITGFTSLNTSGWTDLRLIKTSKLINVVAKGDLTSTNLLEGCNASFINIFNYNVSLPTNTKIEIQFSQDNLSWYNSFGSKNKQNSLVNGTNSINLSSLNWIGANFFYRMYFSSNNENIPILKNINISYNQYLTTGFLISEPYYIKGNPNWMTLSWKLLEPLDTIIEFQIRTSNTDSELLLKEFVGPDGTKTTFYNKSGGAIWYGHYNDNWIQYIAYLSTFNTSITPTLDEIVISYNSFPELLSASVTPSSGDITQLFNFTIDYLDENNDHPKYIRVCIDGINYTMNESNDEDTIFSDGKDYWYTIKLKAGNHTYQFFTSDGEQNCSTNISKLKVDLGPITQIKIDPSIITITTDEYQIFNATGFDEDDNSLSITPTWEITGGGIIDQSGNFTATTPGEWLIYANHSGLSVTSTVIVNLGALDRIIILPESIKINISESVKFSAKGYDADNNELNILPSWEVNGGGTIYKNGSFISTEPGTWIVYANQSGVSGSAIINIISLEDEKYTNDRKSDNIMVFIGIGILIIIIIIIGILVFIFKKKKIKEIKTNETSQKISNSISQKMQSKQEISAQVLKQYESVQLQTQSQQNLCTTCGKNLTYIQQNNKYYCHQCKKYV